MLVCGLGPEFLRVSREWAGNMEGLDSPLLAERLAAVLWQTDTHTAY